MHNSKERARRTEKGGKQVSPQRRKAVKSMGEAGTQFPLGRSIRNLVRGEENRGGDRR